MFYFNTSICQIAAPQNLRSCAEYLDQGKAGSNCLCAATSAVKIIRITNQQFVQSSANINWEKIFPEVEIRIDFTGHR